ncbi:MULTISPECIES: mannose-6-phosphate isomerase, class I [Bacteria]|uniref:mannose-6-phosphate isomerase, class I n=1 Tax=Bacteria TaxID=2 RepID=UPI003C7BE6B0
MTMHRLEASQKDYAWGSRSAIQDHAGVGTAGDPLAEIWYGAHPSGPTRLEDGGTLEELIRTEGAAVLGEDVAERFDGTLPFLVKLIAPGQAVSLQVHPHAERAREGHAAQRADPSRERLFVDPRHKPEQILALTAFEGLVGLRSVDEAAEVLGRLDHPLPRASRVALITGGEAAVPRALALLARASSADVDELVALARPLAAEGGFPPASTLLELAEQYPGDPGVAVSLMLHRVRLGPGDSVLVASGVPHAYMSGLALEVMANSDNVFRLGLTVKRVDVEESIANLLAAPAVVSRPHRPADADAPAEFRLDVHDLGSGEVVVGGAGPRVVVRLSGDGPIRDGSRSVALPRGGAVFLPHGSQAVAEGSGRIAVVSVPAA